MVEQMDFLLNMRILSNHEEIEYLDEKDVLQQVKKKLEEISTLRITYKRNDILGFADDLEAKAIMPCGHAISEESMDLYL